MSHVPSKSLRLSPFDVLVEERTVRAASIPSSRYQIKLGCALPVHGNAMWTMCLTTGAVARMFQADYGYSQSVTLGVRLKVVAE